MISQPISTHLNDLSSHRLLFIVYRLEFNVDGLGIKHTEFCVYKSKAYQVEDKAKQKQNMKFVLPNKM